MRQAARLLVLPICGKSLNNKCTALSNRRECIGCQLMCPWEGGATEVIDLSDQGLRRNTTNNCGAIREGQIQGIGQIGRAVDRPFPKDILHVSLAVPYICPLPFARLKPDRFAQKQRPMGHSANRGLNGFGRNPTQMFVQRR